MRWNSIIRRYVYTFSFCKYYIIQVFTFQHTFIRLVRLCMIVSVIKPYKFVFIILNQTVFFKFHNKRLEDYVPKNNSSALFSFSLGL
jgi:hypothetical protein